LKEERKMKKILQINFKVPGDKSEREKLGKAFSALAPRFGPSGDVKGLLWKIWLVNEAEESAGGIYLFKDEASAEAYLKGEIVASVKKNPAISNFEAKVFDIVPEPTKISRGPVD
jgi:hypothetical protein